MSVLGGLAAGIFGTALLDALVSSPASGGTTVAAADLSGAFGLVGKALSIIVDPSVPAVPDRSGSSSSSPGSSSPAGPAPITSPTPWDPNLGGLFGGGFGPGVGPNTPVTIGPNRQVPAKDLPGRPGSGVSP